MEVNLFDFFHLILEAKFWYDSLPETISGWKGGENGCFYHFATLCE